MRGCRDCSISFSRFAFTSAGFSTLALTQGQRPNTKHRRGGGVQMQLQLHALQHCWRSVLGKREKREKKKRKEKRASENEPRVKSGPISVADLSKSSGRFGLEANPGLKFPPPTKRVMNTRFSKIISAPDHRQTPINSFGSINSADLIS